MQLGQPGCITPSILLSAVSEVVKNIGIQCRTVSSRGELASCPEGECTLLLRLSRSPPETPLLSSILSIDFLRALSQPSHLLASQPCSRSPLVPPSSRPALCFLGNSLQPPQPISTSHSCRSPSFSRASLLAGLAVTSCSCGSACGSWDVREGTICHCQCAGIDWTAARCCALGVGA